MMRMLIVLNILLLNFAAPAMAQPANDECAVGIDDAFYLLEGGYGIFKVFYNVVHYDNIKPRFIIII